MSISICRGLTRLEQLVEYQIHRLQKGISNFHISCSQTRKSNNHQDVFPLSTTFSNIIRDLYPALLNVFTCTDLRPFPNKSSVAITYQGHENDSHENGVLRDLIENIFQNLKEMDAHGYRTVDNREYAIHFVHQRHGFSVFI